MRNAIEFLTTLGAEDMTISSDPCTVMQLRDARVKIGNRRIEVSHLFEDDDLRNYWVHYMTGIFHNDLSNEDLIDFFLLADVIGLHDLIQLKKQHHAA